MVADSFRADKETGCDLPVRLAAGHVVQDLCFARGQDALSEQHRIVSPVNVQRVFVEVEVVRPAMELIQSLTS